MAPSTFDVIPAVDLRAGRVVRLRQGDFDRETVYGNDPAATALAFAEAGASWIHVVDLDGARLGTPRQFESIATIVEAVPAEVSVEVAGGLRSRGAVAAALALGARRAVLGTAALEDPELVGALVARHGAAALVVALDVRGGRVSSHGWEAGRAGDPVEDVLRRLADAGITTFEVTAIERDGELTGPDIELTRRLVELDRGDIIASAGVASLDDLRRLRGVGCRGAIVGRAIYEGRIDLREALEL